MTYANITASAGRGYLETALAPVRAVLRILGMIADAGPRMEQLRQLNQTGDAELAAKGLTRAGEVQRIFEGPLHR